jgi:hypothetical protein
VIVDAIVPIAKEIGRNVGKSGMIVLSRENEQIQKKN